MRANILIVEESPDLCRLFEHMLLADGYLVQTYPDWQAADQALAQREPDLIIFDWVPANSAGYTWAEALANAEDTALIPILFVCGDPPQRTTLEVLGSAGISVIEKPFDIFVFRKRVAALLGIRERALGMS
ncbi:MAG: response regulator [Kouleothrix sp.]|jgi:DNA-binding response OmpR family regulator|nr:response regulator transcription factor [Kouleothrix sp.]